MRTFNIHDTDSGVLRPYSSHHAAMDGTERWHRESKRICAGPESGRKRISFPVEIFEHGLTAKAGNSRKRRGSEQAWCANEFLERNNHRQTHQTTAAQAAGGSDNPIHISVAASGWRKRSRYRARLTGEQYQAAIVPCPQHQAQINQAEECCLMCSKSQRRGLRTKEPPHD